MFHCPNTAGANSLKNTESTKPVITPAMAAAPVVLFQNIPRMNMANTPGTDKAGIFLNEGKAAFAADAQQIVPGKQYGNNHGDKYCDSSRPNQFLFVSFFAEYIFYKYPV